jgi:hypothetical protein
MYQKGNGGNRQDAQFLRRKENDKKSMEMIAKKIHKTRICKCCEGEHRKVNNNE